MESYCGTASQEGEIPAQDEDVKLRFAPDNGGDVLIRGGRISCCCSTPRGHATHGARGQRHPDLCRGAELALKLGRLAGLAGEPGLRLHQAAAATG